MVLGGDRLEFAKFLEHRVQFGADTSLFIISGRRQETDRQDRGLVARIKHTHRPHPPPRLGGR